MGRGRGSSIKLGIRFHDNPLFLRGDRTHETCTAWTNPTYTVPGRRKPCHPLADGHAGKLSEVMSKDVWDRYGGADKDRHCGFESTTIFGALTRSGLTAG